MLFVLFSTFSFAVFFLRRERYVFLMIVGTHKRKPDLFYDPFMQQSGYLTIGGFFMMSLFVCMHPGDGDPHVILQSRLVKRDPTLINAIGFIQNVSSKCHPEHAHYKHIIGGGRNMIPPPATGMLKALPSVDVCHIGRFLPFVSSAVSVTGICSTEMLFCQNIPESLEHPAAEASAWRPVITKIPELTSTRGSPEGGC